MSPNKRYAHAAVSGNAPRVAYGGNEAVFAGSRWACAACSPGPRLAPRFAADPVFGLCGIAWPPERTRIWLRGRPGSCHNARISGFMACLGDAGGIGFGATQAVSDDSGTVSEAAAAVPEASGAAFAAARAARAAKR